MGLIDDLRPGPVALDTAIFIYFIEASPNWLNVVKPLFAAAERGDRELVTSVITLMELLVVPYRNGHETLAARYEALLTNSRGIRLIDVTRDSLRRAARIRSVTGMRTADALQIAAAQEGGCNTFVTNDGRLPNVPGLSIVQLQPLRR